MNHCHLPDRWPPPCFWNRVNPFSFFNTNDKTSSKCVISFGIAPTKLSLFLLEYWAKSMPWSSHQKKDRSSIKFIFVFKLLTGLESVWSTSTNFEFVEQNQHYHSSNAFIDTSSPNQFMPNSKIQEFDPAERMSHIWMTHQLIRIDEFTMVFENLIHGQITEVNTVDQMLSCCIML